MTQVGAGVVPVYLALLLLLKAMQSLAGLVPPIAILLPDWLPAKIFFLCSSSRSCASSSVWLCVPKWVARFGSG